MVIVIIGLSYEVIINMTVIVFCHFSVSYDKIIKKEEKERKSVK